MRRSVTASGPSGLSGQTTPDVQQSQRGHGHVFGADALTENDATRSQNRDSDADQGPDPADTNPSDMREDTSRPKAQVEVLRLAGMGTELAGITLVFMGVGYLVDSVRGHETGYAAAFGTLIGFTLGMIRFIRDVRKITED